jgi:DNA-binding LacI/PurR family transcriptional regulator
MNFQEIKKQLPHGAIKNIAQRSGLSTTTISHIFNGVIESPKQADVLQATAEFMKEYREKKNAATKALTEALSL